MIRVGTGYDVHPLVTGRPLIIGGVLIPFDFGLSGHSDADVLTHAVCDALLGALGEGDLGTHFPDTDSQYQNISSLILLERVAKLIHKAGYQVNNLDVTVIAEAPKLSAYKRAIRSNLALALGVEENAVNIKATTQEGLGFIGHREGIAAHAIVSLIKDQ